MIRPLFSILIPAYKNQFFAEALDSIAKQTYSNFQCIIVDDCSPYHLREIFDNTIGDDSRFEYYKNETNIGAENVVDNWNKCLRYAKGDYVICMGDDDKLMPYCLEEYEKLMLSHPNMDAYHAWTAIIDENSKPFEIQSPRPIQESAYSVLWNRWFTRTRQFIGDFCFKRSSLIEIGGYIKLPLAWSSDDIMAVIMSKKTGIANTQRICFLYRDTGVTISRSSNNFLKLDAIIQEKAWYTDFLKEVPINPIDEIYREMISKNFESFFYHKREMFLWDVLIQPNCNYLEIFSKRNMYGMSTYYTIRIIIKALKFKFVKVIRKK